MKSFVLILVTGAAILSGIAFLLVLISLLRTHWPEIKEFSHDVWEDFGFWGIFWISIGLLFLLAGIFGRGCK